MHHYQCDCHFLNALPVILLQSPQLCENYGLSVLSSIGNREKLQGTKSGEQGRWGMTVMLFLVKTFPAEKRNVRRCLVVMQQPVSSFIAKVWGEVLAHFHAVAIKSNSSITVRPARLYSL
jgi:hypothetical protein